MSAVAIESAGWSAFVLAQVGLIYTLFAAAATVWLLRRSQRQPDVDADVTIIKPLHGAHSGLYDALARFCRQDHRGAVQLVFGVNDEKDAAVPLVRRLQREFPGHDIELIIDGAIHGENRKTSNLINIAARARHEILILSDSDILVEPDYVARVAGALSAPGVGAVSCLYVGKDDGTLWSRLSAMAINYQFLPGAVVGKALGLAQPCFGSTIALRAETLKRIGGFAPFADHLADDFELGRAVRRLGLEVVLPPMIVAHMCGEAGARELIDHELRWGRTVRQIDPFGYVGSLITYVVPLSVVVAALLGPSPMSLALVAGCVAARVAFKLSIDAATRAPAGAWWLTPVRDVLSLGVFAASFAVNTVGWQGRRFRISRQGELIHT
jgi:ceramide glucosyltransferase